MDANRRDHDNITYHLPGQASNVENARRGSILDSVREGEAVSLT